MESVIKSLKSQLAHITIPEGVKAIYLYGSIMKDKIRIDSDIDVAILPSHEIDALERLELISKIQSLFTSLFVKKGLKQEVSVLDLRDKYVSLQLQYKVLTEGILILERDTSERLEFENAVKREYFDFEPYLRFLRKEKYGTAIQKV